MYIFMFTQMCSFLVMTLSVDLIKSRERGNQRTRNPHRIVKWEKRNCCESALSYTYLTLTRSARSTQFFHAERPGRKKDTRSAANERWIFQNR